MHHGTSGGVEVSSLDPTALHVSGGVGVCHTQAKPLTSQGVGTAEKRQRI